MPRTIITILLPALVGVWVGRKAANAWKAITITTLIVGASFLVLAMATSFGSSVMIFFVAVAATGVAESFRAVSITTAAQATLERKDLGVGTSLVNFVNPLSSLIAAAVYGLAYDLNTKGNPENVNDIAAGVKSVFIIAAIVSVIGFVIVILVVRKQMNDKAASAMAAATATASKYNKYRSHNIDLLRRRASADSSGTCPSCQCPRYGR